ncbi:contactin-1a [Rhipicephalus microplus]|uniref:contactin-1a n=1 Tax=Rhipicephalus microplus TaxID=6941 RepID=UPI003F6C7E9C
MMFGKIIHYSFLLILPVSDVFVEASHRHSATGLPSVVEGDLGSHLTLQCNVSRPHHQSQRFVWLKDGRGLGPELSWTEYKYRGDLVSSGLLLSDAGNYSCYLDTPHQHSSAQLIVRAPPGRLSNVTVHPSTVVATVRWHVSSDGGCPISHFTLAYQPTQQPPANSSAAAHHYLPVHISPAARQFFVYHLEPGTPYMFRMWASNRLGPGEATTVYASTSKPLDPAEVVQKMFAGGDDFSTAAWMVAVSMVMGTILILSCLSCLLIYKEGRHEELQDEAEEEEESSAVPHIVANPGFEVDLEESFLLDRPDCNDNNERAVRTNNNSVVRPSHV